MPEYAFSEWENIRRSVLKHYPDKQLVLINDLIVVHGNYRTTPSKVFSVFEPEFKYFTFKIKTPLGKRYKKYDRGGYDIEKISIPATQLNHICKEMRDKKLKFVVLDRDDETGTNHGKRMVIRTDESDNPEDGNRY